MVAVVQRCWVVGMILYAAVEATMAPAAPHMPSHVAHSASTVKMAWSPPLSPGAPIDGYEIQYRQQGKVGSWNTVPMTVAGHTGGAKHEVQTIETMCDRYSGHAISSGSFRLGLNTRGVNGFDTETKTLTANIPWDATSDQMQAALQQLENVGCVHVRRFPTGLCTGCNKWEVEFKPKANTNLRIGNPCAASSHGSLSLPTHSYLWTKAHPGGNIPLLVNRGDHIPNCRMVVAEVQHSSPSGAANSLCHGNSGCTVEATHLVPFRYYQFRVRSHNKFGWGEYSGESDPVLTKAMSGQTNGGFSGSRFASGDQTHVFL